MKKLIAGILSSLVVIGLMAPTGGFPARPRFQGITVADPVAVSALAEFAGNGNVAGTSSLAVGQGGAGISVILSRTTQLNVSSGTGLPLFLNGTQGSGIEVGASPTGGDKGAGTINATGVFVAGVATPAYSDATANFTGNLQRSGVSVPKISFALINQLAPTTCNITGTTSNNVTNCTASSAGVMVVNFTSAYAAAPVCNISAVATATVTTQLSFSSVSTTAANISTDQAGVGTSMQTYVVCFGF